MARREKMTLRDLYNVTAAARGHWVVYGSPKRIADMFEEWFTAERADGFVVMPPYFPGAFEDFVDKVVPELQRRGLFGPNIPVRPCATISGSPGRRRGPRCGGRGRYQGVVRPVLLNERLTLACLS